MKIFIALVLLVGITASLTACGRRGDPVTPQLQQAQ
jgi:predicted small lipoprotein YifL